MEKPKHILSLKDFSRDQIEILIGISEKMESIAFQKRRLDLLKEKVMAVLFFQPSTRTRLSFETAMIRMGGSVIGFADIEQSRAGGATKESVKDNALVIQEYADVIVIRDSREFGPTEFASYANVPVINGGDGANEHPTQGLLDLYTIQKEFGHIDNLNVLIWSQMTFRAIHSFLYGLARYQNVKVYLYAPEEFKMPERFMKDYDRLGLFCKEVKSYEEVIGEIDVFYMNPVRRGRDAVTEKEFVLDYEKLKRAKRGAIVMHPLPRTDELPEEVDDTPHARYFVQSRNGVAMRMALLSYVFDLKV